MMKQGFQIFLLVAIIVGVVGSLTLNGPLGARILLALINLVVGVVNFRIFPGWLERVLA